MSRALVEMIGVQRAYQANARTISATAEMMQSLAPDGMVLPAFLAARWVLLRDYDQKYDAGCYATTKLDPDEILAAEGKLREANFYGKDPAFDPLPQARIRTHRELALETFLKVAWPRIEALGVVFGRYQSQGSVPVSPASIVAGARPP